MKLLSHRASSGRLPTPASCAAAAASPAPGSPRLLAPCSLRPGSGSFGPRRLLVRAPPAARPHVACARPARMPRSAQLRLQPLPSRARLLASVTPASFLFPTNSPSSFLPRALHALSPSPPLPLPRFPLPLPCPSFHHQQRQRKREGITGMPEVEAARRAREAHCVGRRIACCAVADDTKVVVPGSGVTHMAFERAMVGRTIVAAHRRGRLNAPRKARPSPMAEGSSRSCPFGGSLALDDSEVVEVSAEVAAEFAARSGSGARFQL